MLGTMLSRIIAVGLCTAMLGIYSQYGRWSARTRKRPNNDSATYQGFTVYGRSSTQSANRQATQYRERINRLESKISSLEKKVDLLTERYADLRFGVVKALAGGKNVQPLKYPLKVGQIFYFSDEDRIRVLQIIDPTNMLVELQFGHSRDEYGYPRKETVLIAGVSTKDFTDNKLLALPPYSFWRVAETTTYPTVLGGSNTVFVLIPEEL